MDTKIVHSFNHQAKDSVSHEIMAKANSFETSWQRQELTGKKETEDNDELVNCVTDDIFKHGSGDEWFSSTIRFS